MHLRRAVLLTLVTLVVAVVAAVGSGAPAEASGPAIKSVLAIVQGPAPLDAFKRPQGITTDPSRGIIIVADTGNHRVATFDSAYRPRGVMVFDPVDGKDPSEPRSLAIGERMRLFLVDNLSRDVEVLTSRGTHLGYLPTLLTGDASDLARPQDVVVGKSGRIYVLYGGERPGIVIADAAGRPSVRIGFAGRLSGPLNSPIALDVNAEETLIAVADPQAEKPIVLFSTSGDSVAAFGKHGEGDGTFSLTNDVAWGPGETLWITDTVRHSISVLDVQGVYLGRIGGFGRGPGQFDFPSGCAFLAPDRLVVLERAGARFQVLEMEVPASDSPAGAILGQGSSGSSGAGLATLQGR